MTALPTIDPQTLKRRIDEGSAVLIDIREPSEHARERIAGSRLVPLSAIHRHQFTGDKAVVFHCRTGNRTMANAGILLAKNCPEAYALAGGLEAWRTAGLPTEVDHRAPIELFRQVQIAAGSLVLLGLLMAALVSPQFAALSAFVGAGLVFAGITGTCGMARILGIMPWNRMTKPAG